MSICVGVNKIPIQVGWETFQKQATSDKFVSEAFYLPPEVYRKADGIASGSVVRCSVTQDHPDLFSRGFATATTNLTVRVLNARIREPFAKFGNTPETCDRVFKDVMALMPKPGEQIEDDLRGEFFKKAQNIVRSYYMTQIAFLHKRLVSQSKSPNEIKDILSRKIIDAIACQTVREYNEDLDRRAVALGLEEKVREMRKQRKQQ